LAALFLLGWLRLVYRTRPVVTRRKPFRKESARPRRTHLDSCV